MAKGQKSEGPLPVPGLSAPAFLECTEGGTVWLHLSRLVEMVVQLQRGSPSSARVAPRGAWAITKLRNCLLEPSPPKNAWLLSGCLSVFGFPKGWKTCHPKHFPEPLPQSELMGAGLYLKTLFSSMVCLSQGVEKREKLWALGLCTLASAKCALINTRIRNCGLRVYGGVDANYIFSHILPQARAQAAKSKCGLENFFLLLLFLKAFACSDPL